MDLPCDLSRSCEGFGKSMGGALHWIDAVPVAKPSVSVVMWIGRYSYSVIQVHYLDSRWARFRPVSSDDGCPL
jgi:hypothetical protein